MKEDLINEMKPHQMCIAGRRSLRIYEINPGHLYRLKRYCGTQLTKDYSIGSKEMALGDWEIQKRRMGEAYKKERNAKRRRRAGRI